MGTGSRVRSVPRSRQPDISHSVLCAVRSTWARPARLIRGVGLSAKERGLALGARGFGASDLSLMRRHILPSTWGVVLTQATVLIPQFLLAEVTLSFLGSGIGEPVPSWGNMLAQ